MNKIRWVAVLDNGKVCEEGQDGFSDVEGGLSSWQNLKQYCANGGVKILDLFLKDDVREYRIPVLIDPDRVKEYRYYKKVSCMIGGNENGKVRIERVCVEMITNDGTIYVIGRDYGEQ